MPTIAMTLPVARRNPAVLPRRDVVLTVGDVLILELTLVQRDDPAADPLDLTGIGLAVRAVVTNDAGRLIVEGDFVDAAAGRVDITLPAATAVYDASSVLDIQYNRGGYISTLLRGVLQARSTAVMGHDEQPILGDTYGPILSDGYQPVEV